MIKLILYIIAGTGAAFVQETILPFPRAATTQVTKRGIHLPTEKRGCDLLRLSRCLGGTDRVNATALVASHQKAVGLWLVLDQRCPPIDTEDLLGLYVAIAPAPSQVNFPIWGISLLVQPYTAYIVPQNSLMIALSIALSGGIMSTVWPFPDAWPSS